MGLNKLDMVSAMALGMKEFKKHINNKDVARELKQKFDGVTTDEFIDDMHREAIRISDQYDEDRKVVLHETRGDNKERKTQLDHLGETLLQTSMEIGVLIRAYFEMRKV